MAKSPHGNRMSALTGGGTNLSSLSLSILGQSSRWAINCCLWIASLWSFVASFWVHGRSS